MGWVERGDLVVDPFGGVACGGIVCGYQGLRYVGIELEPRFVALGNQNIDLHRARMEQAGDPVPVLIQGDSRQLASIVSDPGCVLSSPPYTKEALGHPRGKSSIENGFKQGSTAGGDWSERYGTSPGQLGSMKAGDVSAVLSSPPYAETNVDTQEGLKGIDREKLTPGSLTAGSKSQEARYGETPGQLGKMKAGEVGAVVSSPPFMDQQDGGGICKTGTPAMQKTGGGPSGTGGYRDQAATNGNLATESGTTFWEAAFAIVSQCFAILRPGGHACWVVKNFVRDKQVVDFTGDWQRLCEACGFRLVCRHRAMLVKSQDVPTLFDGTETKTTSRKSFFRRLAESKGSPRIDWETVLCMEKP